MVYSCIPNTLDWAWHDTKCLINALTVGLSKEHCRWTLLCGQLCVSHLGLGHMFSAMARQSEGLAHIPYFLGPPRTAAPAGSQEAEGPHGTHLAHWFPQTLDPSWSVKPGRKKFLLATPPGAGPTTSLTATPEASPWESTWPMTGKNCTSCLKPILSPLQASASSPVPRRCPVRHLLWRSSEDVVAD